MSEQDFNWMLSWCPFNREKMTKDELDWFKSMMRYVGELEQDRETLNDVKYRWSDLNKMLSLEDE